MFPFTPRHIKEGKHYRHHLKRFIHYKEDILPAKELTLLRGLVDKMTAAIKGRKREEISVVSEEIEKQVGRISPPLPDAGWRENVEVYLVAIIIAAGVRAYFLQPFKIPTGSMQPTLFGIVGYPTQAPLPNPITRAAEFLWLGRSYIDAVAQKDGLVVNVQDKDYLNYFTFADITYAPIGPDGEPSSDPSLFTHQTVFAPRDCLIRNFSVYLGRRYQKGETIAHGFIDTGDMVFVDKFSYNFIRPAAGDVFVFLTTSIYKIAITLPPGVESEHYIKRLAGVSGDTLRIDSPKLYRNGQLATDPVFVRVMSCLNGYRGYSNPSAVGQNPAAYLTTPQDVFKVPPHAYFALGDNSYDSLDSRYWGIVPEHNVVGRGLFVFWPFSYRWGLIH